MHYRWHPLFGQELCVVRACGTGDQLHLEVQLDGYRLAVPAWMTDQELCSGLHHVAQPVCSLTSLQSLQRLVQACGL